MAGEIDVAALYRELGGISAKLDEQGADIKEIRAQTTQTNGRVNRHDVLIDGLINIDAQKRLARIERERAAEAGASGQRRESVQGRWLIAGALTGLFGGAGLIIVRAVVQSLAG